MPIDDDTWIPFEHDDVISVSMVGYHALAYQRWLHTHGLYLQKIPVDVDQPEVYVVGVSDEAWLRVLEGPLTYIDGPVPDLPDPAEDA